MGSSEQTVGAKLVACLPMQLRHIPDAAREEHFAMIQSGPQIQRPTNLRRTRYERGEDPIAILSSKIESIEQKLDTLVALILRNERQIARQKGVFLELHGQGLSFRWPKAFEKGQTLELEITLSLLPPIEIICLAEVVECKEERHEEGGDVKYTVTVKFVAIGENDLDAVHRFILTSQRENRRVVGQKICVENGA